jgi:hypothetical protein
MIPIHLSKSKREQDKKSHLSQPKKGLSPEEKLQYRDLKSPTTAELKTIVFDIMKDDILSELDGYPNLKGVLGIINTISAFDDLVKIAIDIKKICDDDNKDKFIPVLGITTKVIDLIIQFQHANLTIKPVLQIINIVLKTYVNWDEVVQHMEKMKNSDNTTVIIEELKELRQEYGDTIY